MHQVVCAKLSWVAAYFTLNQKIQKKREREKRKSIKKGKELSKSLAKRDIKGKVDYIFCEALSSFLYHVHSTSRLSNLVPVHFELLLAILSCVIARRALLRHTYCALNFIIVFAQLFSTVCVPVELLGIRSALGFVNWCR